jgi:uncharacterized protein
VLPLALALLAVSFPQGEAVLRAPTKSVTIKVEIARTAEQMQQGLMGRTSLPRNAGMVFLFGQPTSGSFWMKDTRIPLSIAFFGKRGRILRIMDMTPCLKDPCRSYTPGVAYWGALEVNRGAFKRWRVRAGNYVTIRR